MWTSVRIICLVSHILLVVTGTVLAEDNVTSSASKEPLKERHATKDENDLEATTWDETLLLETLINSGSVNLETSVKDDNQRNEDVDDTLAIPTESKATTSDIRRQGTLKQDVEEKQQDSDSQFDDAKQDRTEPPLRKGQRFRNINHKESDEAPVLRLTQGGYQSPYRQTSRFRHRQATRTDSSEQSEKVQEPTSIIHDNRGQEPARLRVMPQVSYSVNQSPQQRYNPLLNNHVGLNQASVPPPLQNRYFNSAPSNIFDYTNPSFRAQFPPSNEILFSSFPRYPSNSALGFSSSVNPFQSTHLLFPNTPQVQSQPMTIEPSSNLQQYPNLENAEDFSRTNFAPLSSYPAVGAPFQVTPDFYEFNSNEAVNGFNDPSNVFLSPYPRYDARFRNALSGYPSAADDQSDIQPASDTSQEDKKAKEIEPQTDKNTNENLDSVEFGARFRPQNGADVFIRYPIREAGYATEENLPSANGTRAPKENSRPYIPEGRNFFSNDPYRDALYALRNQRENESAGFIPGLFRDTPIDFGYQGRPNQVFAMEYPGRTRDTPRFQPPDSNGRQPIRPLLPQVENPYLFINPQNERQDGQLLESQPLCAKPNNASFCFEDENYPRNDILYSVNSNAFLMDRMSGIGSRIDSTFFVEQNESATERREEKYACSVDTKYGKPLRGKSLSGSWRVIVNLETFSQPVRMEVCRSKGDHCNYIDPNVKTTCLQKYSIQRLLTWSSDRGIFTDLFKIPVACSCQIL